LPPRSRLPASLPAEHAQNQERLPQRKSAALSPVLHGQQGVLPQFPLVGVFAHRPAPGRKPEFGVLGVGCTVEGRAVNTMENSCRASPCPTFGLGSETVDWEMEALLVLASLHKGETFDELAAGFGIGRTTAGRYVSEVVELLAARAPKLRGAVRDAKRAGHASVILDGTLIPIDRVAADRPFYSGKHKRRGMNLRIVASPDGDILWVPGALPGSVHDKRAEWIWGVLDELERQGLVVLADKGYQGSTSAKLPYKGRNKPEPQKAANRAHAKLGALGERANAQLKTWKIFAKLRSCPWRAGKLPKAIHVLQLRVA
jgi:hypothetical protein